MTPEAYEKIGELYHAALELASDQRGAFLERVCGRDEELQREVESLIEAHEHAGDFISSPAFEIASELLEDQEPPLLTAGRRISHYQVISLLGTGGMGEVYLAQDIKLGRKVALKVLLKKFTHELERIWSLEREARAASALNHPNIITIYEIGRIRGMDFIAAEFVEGETLRACMTKRSMEINEAVDIATQVSGALAVAHGAGVVHRDIKPENIMLRHDRIVKLLDFGLTKLTQNGNPAAETQVVYSDGPQEEHVDTEPGVVMGTISYMSPEQLRGAAAVDRRTDIWSLGVVLYEMVTGHAPFAGKDSYGQIVAIREKDPLPLSQFVAGVPERLEEIIHKALTKDLDERYQSAEELLVDLQNLKRRLDIEEEMSRSPAHELLNSGADVRSTVSGAGATAKQSLRKIATSEQAHPALSSGQVIIGEIARHKRGFAVTAILLVLLLTAFLFGLYKHFRPASPPHVTSGPIPSVVPFTTFPGDETDPAFSPDGNQIAFAWNGGGGTSHNIYIKQRETGTPVRLTSGFDTDRHPVWSPDGNYIAFFRLIKNENSIVIVPALGGRERVLHSAPAVDFPTVRNALSWSRDGKSLAFVERASSQDPYSAYLLSVDSLDRRKITSPPSGTYGDNIPAISPDGKTLAFIRYNSTAAGEIHLAPVAGGESRALTSDTRRINGFSWTPDSREIVFASNRSGTQSLWKIPVSGGAPEKLVFGGENISSPTISAQGQQLAYAQRVLDTNIWRIDVSAVNLRSSGPTKFIASTRSDDSPQFSADGKKIAFSSARSGVYQIWTCDADGTNLFQLTSLESTNGGSPRWSPDGRRIAFSAPREGQQDIYVVDASGGEPRRLTVEPSDEVRPSWSRDGRNIYFASNRGGEWQVWKSPVDGGRAERVTTQGGREAFESPDGKFVYYSKGFDVYGLWRVPILGGEEVKILDQVTQGYWAECDLGIYFVDPQARPRPVIKFFSFATRGITQVATVENALLWTGPSLAVSSDGRSLLYAQVDKVESDIMLVKNFR